MRDLVGDGLKLEVGVGTGVFAQRLGVQVGIDPARAVLEYSKGRGVRVVRAVGEFLPFRGETFDYVLMIVTICFLHDAVKALSEARRVLKTGGSLVVGMVTRDSRWGKLYEQKKRRGHRFYRHARFSTLEETMERLGVVGFVVEERRSSLRKGPKMFRDVEEPGIGSSSEFGFHVIKAIKTKKTASRK